MRSVVCFLLGLAPLAHAGAGTYFTPHHRLSGIGVGRDDISDELLRVRTDFMTQSQTFAILREPLAVPGAKRITSPKLQSIFRKAAASSGMPANVIEAIAYLESWGDPKAESPAGPRGIMQIADASSRRIGLRVVHA
jgi:soluble lytic murein transglycosylase-like protein